MTGSLLLPDLTRIPADAASLLGRAVALGMEYGRLPEGTAARVAAFLRVHGTQQARRLRTGLRLEREALEAGIRQGAACLDMALEEASGGNVNQAVALLAETDLEPLRRRGWEVAFGRLQEMRQESLRLFGLAQTALMDEHRARLRTWSTVVPETWTATSRDGTVRVDPQAEYAAFVRVRWCAQLVASLPAAALQELLARGPRSMTFLSLLRRLVVAVALERPSLLVDAAAQSAFAAAALGTGRLRQEVRRRVCEQLGTHVRQALSDPGACAFLDAQVAAALADLAAGGAARLDAWIAGPSRA